MLIGGLGVGFSLDEAVRHAGTVYVTVVELEKHIIEWNHSYFQEWNKRAPENSKTKIVEGDLQVFLEEEPNAGRGNGLPRRHACEPPGGDREVPGDGGQVAARGRGRGVRVLRLRSRSNSSAISCWRTKASRASSRCFSVPERRR